MLSTALMLLLSGAFLSLRLGPGSGGSFPRPLSAAEERAAVDAWVGSADLAARNRLIEHNLRLVAHIVKKYYAQTTEQEDLISIGTIGLIKGVSTYRPDRGVRLATYASRCIENEILMYFRSRRKSAGDLSLSDSLDADGDGGSLSILDVLAEEDDMLENLSAQELRRQVAVQVERALEPREAEIVRARYGLGGQRPLTQREVASRCGISRSYVSRIEKRALEKLRRALGDG
jgi:RNA polymerase sporulation-specific sigma factor